jgi:uncharacterized protein YwbE
MGKIKQYIAELAETFEDMLWHTETWGAAINQMSQILSPDEFKFFTDHIEDIKEFIHMDDNAYPANEARGLKGDVLRPYGGRKARTDMGYGKGNRANYDPEEMRDEEDWDEDDDIPYPGGLTQDDYDLDYDHDTCEDVYPTNEDWTFIQEVALISLIPLLGALAINYINSKDEGIKAEELKAGWKDWISDLRRKISPSYDRKMVRKEEQEELKVTRAKVRDAIEQFGEGKLTIEEVEKIITQDPAIASAVKSMMQDPKLGYQKLYNALKRALNVQGVRGTPIPDIKDRFVGKAADYQKNRKVLRDEVKNMLIAFSEGRATIEDVKEAAEKIPEGEEIIHLLNEFLSGKFYNRDKFYFILKQLFMVRNAQDTPGPKVIRELKKKYTASESLVMPSINEYWDDDEKREQRRWDAAEDSRRRFKEREQTAGEYSDEDERDFVRSQRGLYVKVGKMYMPALYHTPDIGRTDGKLYRKNNKTGGYFPVKG